MKKNIILTNLSNDGDLKHLIQILTEIYRLLDSDIVIEYDPNGTVEGSKGQRFLYCDLVSNKYYISINVDGETTWKKTELT